MTPAGWELEIQVWAGLDPPEALASRPGVLPVSPRGPSQAVCTLIS